MTTPRRPARKPEPVEVEVEEEVHVVQVTEVIEEFEFVGSSGDYTRRTTTRVWLEAIEDD